MPVTIKERRLDGKEFQEQIEKKIFSLKDDAEALLEYANEKQDESTNVLVTLIQRLAENSYNQFSDWIKEKDREASEEERHAMRHLLLTTLETLDGLQGLYLASVKHLEGEDNG